MSLAEISTYWWPVHPPSRPLPPDGLAPWLVSIGRPSLMRVGISQSRLSAFCCLQRTRSREQKKSIKHPAQRLHPPGTASPPRVQSQSQKDITDGRRFESHRIGIADRVAGVCIFRPIVPAASCVARCAARVSFLSCLDPFVETLIALHLPDGLPKPKLLVAPPGMQSC